MSVSTLLPLLLVSGGPPQIVFLDPMTLLVYDFTGNLVSEQNSKKVVSEVMSQQEQAMPKIPYEQIREVMDTERKLSKENENHIFRRKY